MIAANKLVWEPDPAPAASHAQCQQGPLAGRSLRTVHAEQASGRGAGECGQKGLQGLGTGESPPGAAPEDSSLACGAAAAEPGAAALVMVALAAVGTGEDDDGASGGGGGGTPGGGGGEGDTLSGVQVPVTHL